MFERLFVWCGGAIFAASIATTGWWFMWPLGRMTAPADGRLARLALDSVLFSVFALHHSLFARTPLKSWLAEVTPKRLVRSIYVWIASLLLLAVCFGWRPIGGVVYQASGLFAAGLLVVQLAGAALIALSVGAIDPLELAGIHPPRAPGVESQALQVTGPYHLVRHPLYLGWMLIVFGAATVTADRLAFATISSLYLIMAIPWEEQSLEASFGEAYGRYRQHVRWRVIPYIY